MLILTSDDQSILYACKLGDPTFACKISKKLK